MSIKNQNPTWLAWIDLEMTGLDCEQDSIIEIATIVTDDQLEVMATGPVLAIQTPAPLLAGMDEWNTKTHTESGLVKRCLDSEVSLAEAEAQTLEFLSAWIAPGHSPMAGNSICQDRRFLARQMPELEAFFHYRNLDVSTLKELGRRWAPEVVKGFQKKGSHRALDDIRESIDELKHYRAYMGRLGGQANG
jgi:oligoribonuclease